MHLKASHVDSWNIKCALSFFALVSIFATHLWASQNPPVSTPPGIPSSIRVVCDNNYPPYAFTSSDGKLQGIVVDQWKAWERATGVRVEVSGLPWSEAIAAFNSGKADVLDTVFKTPERSAIYDFTEPYARLEVPVFIHKTISGIASVEDLRGFKIAVKDGDAAIGELHNQGFRELSIFPSYEAIIDAAVKLDIRIFCVDKPPALYLLYKRGADRDFRIAFTLNEGAFHRAVKKGRTKLFELVKSGFTGIPNSTYASINRKWLGSEISRIIDFRIISAVGGVSLFLFLLLLVNAWLLRRRVAKATSELKEKVTLLETSEAKNRAFIAALPDLFFIFDREGRFLEFNTSIPENLAVPPESFLGKRIDEIGFAPAISETFIANLKDAFARKLMTSFEYELPFKGVTRIFEGRIAPINEERALLVSRDITENRAREEQIKASLVEKEVLIKEVHHRVKNNMQVISSLIQLQSYALRDERDRELMRETQARIRAMAQIHELLYRSRDLASVDAGEYLDAIVEELALGYGSSGLRCHGDSIPLGLDEAVPLGLIANELVINAIKYAYPEGAFGSISANLTKENGDILLSVSDKGVGLPAGVDPSKDDSMGFTIVRSLVAQLSGTLSFSGPPGFTVDIRFPASPAK